MKPQIRIVKSFGALRRQRGPIVLAAGFFDGVHVGHRRVIREALRRAQLLGGRVWVLTLDPHPMKLLSPDNAPDMLTSTVHKLIMLSRLGVSGCLLLRFGRSLARTEADEFAKRVLSCVPPVAELVVGSNWRFGRRGRGTAERLEAMGVGTGLRVTVVPPVTVGGAAVSSTRIRRLVKTGALGEASRLLGAPVTVFGTVVHGCGMGRKLGFPTANLDLHSEVIPPAGIYAARVRLGRRLRAAALYIGTRPTFGGRGQGMSIEAHIPGVRRPLYGTDLEVSILRMIRSDRRFASADELRAAIARDITVVRRRG